MLGCTSGYPTCKEWVFYPRCLLCQVSVSGRKWRSVSRSAERGENVSLLKTGSEIICTEKPPWKKTGCGLCLKSLWENRYLCSQSAETENKLWGNVVRLFCGFWLGLLISVKCQDHTELHAHLGCVPAAAGGRAAVCPLSVTQPWVLTLLLTAPFSISDGGKAKATAILHLHLWTVWRRSLL